MKELTIWYPWLRAAAIGVTSTTAVSNSGFSFTQSTDPNNSNLGGNGAFFGEDASSVGGNFVLVSGSVKYSGVYKAKK